MHKIYTCQKAESDITATKVCNDSSIAYSTKLHGIKIFDFFTCEIKKNIQNDHLKKNVTASAFSPNKQFFAFSDTKYIYTLDIGSEEIIQTTKIYEEIGRISFDPSSSYIVTGDKSGTVLQYKVQHDTPLSKLCSSSQGEEKSFINTFAFYENMFACCNAKGTIHIFDLYTKTNKQSIKHNKNRINTLVFSDQETLLCGKENGKVTIIYLAQPKESKTITTPIPSITHIVVIPGSDYAALSGNADFITIIDIKNRKIVYSKYIKLNTQIDYIAYVKEDALLVTTQNKELLHIALPGISKLKSLLLHNSLKEAFELVAKEVLLQDSNEYELLEERFNKQYEKALDALINQNREEAELLLDAYKGIPAKKTSIQELFKAFENYDRFQKIIAEKKYALAYAMCLKYKPLQKTPHYKNLQQTFQNTFFKAQKEILSNNINAAKALLNPYSTVASKRPQIKLLLSLTTDFTELLKAIKKNDFKSIGMLIEKNALLKQVPNYITLKNRIEEVLTRVESYIDTMSIDKAKKLLDALEDFPDFYTRRKEMYQKCSDAASLKMAYDDNNFKECYEIIDKHIHLYSVEIGKLLQKHWIKLIRKCEDYALEGNIKDIKSTLGSLIDITSRSEKITDLLQVAFDVRIDAFLQKGDFFAAEHLIYDYIDTMGIDERIAQIMKKFEKISTYKLALTQGSSQKSSQE